MEQKILEVVLNIQSNQIEMQKSINNMQQDISELNVIYNFILTTIITTKIIKK